MRKMHIFLAAIFLVGALITADLLAGDSAYNTPERDVAIAATGFASVSGTDKTMVLSTSFQNFAAIEGDADDVITNTSDFTVSASGWSITCHFAGTVSLTAMGSFSLSANGEVEGHFYNNAVDLLKGFERDITNFGSFGSFSAPGCNIVVADGDVITLHLKVDSGTPTMDLHDFAIRARRVL